MKKLLTILLALCLVGGLMPGAAWADVTWNESTQDNNGVTTKTTEVTTADGLNAALTAVNNTNTNTTWIIKLTNDITIDSTLVIDGKTVTLDLNGYVLKYENGSVEGSVIEVASGGNLTITDSRASDDTASHKFKVDTTQDDLWVLVDNNARETGVEYRTVTGGIITGGKSKRGGGIDVNKNATFKLKSGNIIGCVADKCGGVFVDSNGTFTMQGGSIKGCLSKYFDNGDLNDGGGVYLANESSFVMENGCIEECTGRNGGGVYIRAYSGTMHSGAGGFTMKGGRISDCISLNGGDAVHADGYFTLSGGTISGSQTSIKTSLVFATHQSDVKITSGEIKGDRQQSDVYAISGKVNISGGIITGNCDLYENSTISGGTLNGNIKGTSDITGGIYSGTISGGTFYSDDDNFYKAIKLEGSGEVKDSIYVIYKVEGKNYAKQIIETDKSWSPKGLSSKPGYTFDGWYTDASKSCSDNEKYYGKCPVSGSETITLYYNWIEKSYNVKFDYDDGASQIKTSKVKWTGEALSGISEPTREGYNFKGWMYGNTLVSSDTKYKDLVPNDDAKNDTITLKAQWEKIRTHYGGSRTQYPTIETPEHGTITLAANGRSVTITPDEGYEIASVTVNGEDKGAVSTLSGLRTGNKIAATFQKTKETLDAEAKAAVAALSTMKARSSRTAKGNIKVVAKISDAEKAKLAELTDLGYTVKYRFYRSTKKASSYKAMLEGTTGTYINTIGKAGTRYYYKAQIRVYDANGTLVAKTELKNCKYATRRF